MTTLVYLRTRSKWILHSMSVSVPLLRQNLHHVTPAKPFFCWKINTVDVAYECWSYFTLYFCHDPGSLTIN